MALKGRKPVWLTFDCYGTLAQWDEGLVAAVAAILARQGSTSVDPETLIRHYDKHEHELEQRLPHQRFREVASHALALAMQELNLSYSPSDLELLTASISQFPPFPEVPAALDRMNAMGFNLCIISNTDDDIIAGNVAQMGGHIDRVISAEQAGAYKPSRRIFEHAWRQLGVDKDHVVHICASPHLDHAAARDLGFRCIWVDRGTGRQPLPDYRPDHVVAALDEAAEYLAVQTWERAEAEQRGSG